MSRQIDTKITKQIRIDSGWHKILKRIAANQQTSIKSFVEGVLADHLTSEVLKELLE